MRKKIFLILLILVLCFTTEASACTFNCSYCKNRETTNTRILKACKKVTKIFRNRSGVHFSLGDDLIWDNISKVYKKGKAICSPTYVALVLYASKTLTKSEINAYNYHWCGDGGLPSMLESAGFKKIKPSQAKPGDILIDYGVNAMIYAGKGRCWHVNSCVGPATGKPITYDITGYSVYRAFSNKKKTIAEGRCAH